MGSFWDKAVNFFTGDSEEEQNRVEYEFSNDPKLDAENKKLLAQFEAFAKTGGAAGATGGMSTTEYIRLLQSEGGGR